MAHTPQYEYRVMWRRSDWYQTQSRCFERIQNASAFVNKLLGSGRPDLDDIVELTVSRREVGQWEMATAQVRLEISPNRWWSS